MGASLGNSSSRRRGRRQMAEINVTPFVDVMLVLLVIFMVAAPLMTTGIEVDLPKASTNNISNEEQPITVFINKSGQVSIGEQLINPAYLGDKLIAVTKANKELRIFVKGGAEVQYGEIMNIMAKINKAGYTKVALITDAE